VHACSPATKELKLLHVCINILRAETRRINVVKNLYGQLKDEFLNQLDELRADKRETERDIVERATTELKRLEQQLIAFTFHESIGKCCWNLYIYIWLMI